MAGHYAVQTVSFPAVCAPAARSGMLFEMPAVSPGQDDPPNDFDLIRSKVPEISAWIDRTLKAHEHEAKRINAYQFRRLPFYFSQMFLPDVRVVETQALPRLPLAAMGLPQFAKFETMPLSAITYRNTYFILPDVAKDEALHVHEMVHVAQWQYLTDERFILNYGIGLSTFGYEEHPMETMAKLLEEDFRKGKKPYAMDAWVRSKLNGTPWIFVT